MTTPSETTQVKLDGTKFVAVGFDAHLEFTLDNNVMDMYHTYTAPSARGQGLAGIITLFAFQHCKKENIQVRPSCSYISTRFLHKHPEFRDICV
jgi:predicted GNAT family acetyltransferase